METQLLPTSPCALLLDLKAATPRAQGKAIKTASRRLSAEYLEILKKKRQNHHPSLMLKSEYKTAYPSGRLRAIVCPHVLRKNSI